MAESNLRLVKRQRTRRELATAAFELATLHGVDGFTVDDIVSQAGYSRRTFSNYFAAKEEAIVAIAMERAREALGAIAIEPTSGAILDDIVAILRAQLTTDVIATHAQLNRLARAHPTLTPYLREVEYDGFTESARLLQMQSGGRLTLIQSVMISSVAIGAINALLDGHLEDEFTEFDFDEFAEVITSFLRDGIKGLTS
ncbi:TetR/AcrR family transcriptional regulator [Glaciihabitans sp. UYNi722]|uniref:TetR/AcrR family transcriptional regulator n=1 Tax=Glaciihabitans sp. UYNi722 TaxID=3156344 RepID=UPI00339847A6